MENNQIIGDFLEAKEKAIKAVDTEQRTVKGLFASYNFADSYLDVLQPGCCEKSIRDKGPGSSGGNKIKHLKDHDFSQVVARIDVLEERKVKHEGEELEGLYHESYYPETETSNDLFKKISEGLYDARSIGFVYKSVSIATKDSDSDSDTKEMKEAWEEFFPKVKNKDAVSRAGFFFVVKEIDLWEGSDVAFGANPQTPLLGFKAENADALTKKYHLCKKIMNTGEINPNDYRRVSREVRRFEAGDFKAKIPEAISFMLHLK